jgi:cytosine/creatinine deaminase
MTAKRISNASALDDYYLSIAAEEARKGLRKGGIPIGCVLVMDGVIIGLGRNRRVQCGDPIRHAELDAIRKAGRRSAAEYKRMTVYTTLSPCHMCTGAILLYKIPRVVIGDNQTFEGPEWLLHRYGVALAIVESSECRQLMQSFIEDNPSLWDEDIGR